MLDFKLSQLTFLRDRFMCQRPRSSSCHIGTWADSTCRQGPIAATALLLLLLLLLQMLRVGQLLLVVDEGGVLGGLGCLVA